MITDSDTHIHLSKARGADYTEAVHEGLGSNAAYGPRPFVKNAEAAMAERGRKIAEDVIRRRYKG